MTLASASVKRDARHVLSRCTMEGERGRNAFGMPKYFGRCKSLLNRDTKRSTG